MSPIQIIDVRQNILEANDKIANDTRQMLREKKIFLLNLQSSPGAGKTRLLTATINALKNEFVIGVMEAAIDSDVDARRIADTGVRVVQLHTGNLGHMDASMTQQGLTSLDLKGLDLIVLEDIGNLVGPMEFDTGASKTAVILSVGEGDDKPLKYPLLFGHADIVLVNKVDVIEYFDFDFDKVIRNIHLRRPGIPVLPVSARTGAGIDVWTGWLRNEIMEWKKN